LTPCIARLNIISCIFLRQGVIRLLQYNSEFAFL
jgi:hypothetical protein